MQATDRNSIVLDGPLYCVISKCEYYDPSIRPLNHFYKDPRGLSIVNFQDGKLHGLYLYVTYEPQLLISWIWLDQDKLVSDRYEITADGFYVTKYNDGYLKSAKTYQWVDTSYIIKNLPVTMNSINNTGIHDIAKKLTEWKEKDTILTKSYIMASLYLKFSKKHIAFFHSSFSIS